MGCLFNLITILLFVIIFLGAGVDKIVNPSETASFMNQRYSTFTNWLTNNSQFKDLVPKIPPQGLELFAVHVQPYLEKDFIQLHSQNIIRAIGGV